MKNLTKSARFWEGMMLLSMCAATGCDDNDNNGSEAENVSIPSAKELVGAWEAEGYQWDIENGNGACYLMTEDGSDFVFDDAGNYVTISVKEYCEQYAEDYNADPENTVEGTAADFAYHPYEGTYAFTNINVTANDITIYIGQRVPGTGTMGVLAVQGAYTYDAGTGVMTVDDVANSLDLRTLKIDVRKGSRGMMYFRYSDFDIFTTYSYDGTKNYYVYAPLIFHCQAGEAYDPDK